MIHMQSIAKLDRTDVLRRGRQLQRFTIAWNCFEGLASIAAGVLAGSVSLVGFGLDSLIEIISGAAVLWRVHAELDTSRKERIERQSLRIVGPCFLVRSFSEVAQSVVTTLRIRLAHIA
jgi:hypothetical protein